jgi:hypothetical protein
MRSDKSNEERAIDDEQVNRNGHDQGDLREASPLNGNKIDENAPRARLCHLKKWPHFQGYGFNLHAERSKMGQHIGKVDADSPAESAGLKEGDRIIEVNFVNISNENHQQVVKRIRNGLEIDGHVQDDEVVLLVLDHEADEYYKSLSIVVRSDFENVLKLKTADASLKKLKDLVDERESERKHASPRLTNGKGNGTPLAEKKATNNVNEAEAVIGEEKEKKSPVLNGSVDKNNNSSSSSSSDLSKQEKKQQQKSEQISDGQKIVEPESSPRKSKSSEKPNVSIQEQEAALNIQKQQQQRNRTDSNSSNMSNNTDSNQSNSAQKARIINERKENLTSTSTSSTNGINDTNDSSMVI